MDVEALKKVGIFDIKDGIYFNPSICEMKDYNELYEELVRIGIIIAPFDKIRELFDSDSTDPVKISDEIEEYNPAKDDYIKINVAKDKLEAYIDVQYPGTGEEILYEEVLHKVLVEGIRYNIEYDKLKKIVKNKIFAEKEVIARGSSPIYGVEAQIVMEVDTDINTEPIIMDDGSVDFRQVNLLKTVEKDQLLAVKIPAEKGTDGTDVLGDPIDSTGKDKTLPMGKNTYISDDGLSLFAATNGRIIKEKNILNVENILTIEGDIDYSTGNIDFNGDVAISGDVLSGFKVVSTGDIRIKGTVEAAEIISTEGSIIVSRGIVGQAKARIIAKKDIKADFINESTVSAGNDVEIGEYAIGSNITAEGEVRAIQGRGMIVGGKIYAEKMIDAKVAGSPNNVRTELHIGGRIDKEVYEKMLYIEKDLENLEKRKKGINKDIEFIELLKKKLPKFPERKKEDLKKLIIKLKKIEQLIEEVTAKKTELEKSFGSSVSEDKKIIRVNTIHRGVLVGIDQNKVLAEYTYKLVIVQSKDGELKMNYKTRFL